MIGWCLFVMRSKKKLWGLERSSSRVQNRRRIWRFFSHWRCWESSPLLPVCWGKGENCIDCFYSGVLPLMSNLFPNLDFTRQPTGRTCPPHYVLYQSRKPYSWTRAKGHMRPAGRTYLINTTNKCISSNSFYNYVGSSVPCQMTQFLYGFLKGMWMSSLH